MKSSYAHVRQAELDLSMGPSSRLGKRQPIIADALRSRHHKDQPSYNAWVAMTASIQDLACWVVGEAWKRPFIGRTLFSLRISEVGAQVSDYWATPARQPMTYADLVYDALKRTGPKRYALIVPAGIVATRKLPQALTQCLKAIRSGCIEKQRLNADEIPCAPVLAQGVAPGETTFLSFATAGLLNHLPTRYRYAVQEMSAQHLGAETSLGWVIVHGRQTFEELARDPERLSLEPSLEPLRTEALRTLRPGCVFRCNTEKVNQNLTAAHGCDTLVTVASGIKPWHLASELRKTLRWLIVVDTNPAQLRFAHDAFEAIGAADSWSDICSLPGYSPKSEETSRAEHDQLYQAVCAGRADWSFHTLFLQCNMLTQTFRLIEFLKKTARAQVGFLVLQHLSFVL